ncbi:MAG: hypothetical protein ACE5GS_13545 [Kiloniellaceae bacterium]
MRTMRNGSATLVTGALIAFCAAPAFALDLVDTSSRTNGETTITWDSSFEDLDYTLGDPITMTVMWTFSGTTPVVATPIFDAFVLKRKGFTPSSRKDPADGVLEAVGPVSGSQVDVDFRFTCLHLDDERNVELGNAHFKLLLRIDKNGDGVLDSRAGYGVNVHVEDPYPFGVADPSCGGERPGKKK